MTDALAAALADVLTARVASGAWRVVAIGSGRCLDTVLADLSSLADPVIILIDGGEEKEPAIGGGGDEANGGL